LVVNVVSEGVGAKKDADEPTPYSYLQRKTLHLKKGYADGPISRPCYVSSRPPTIAIVADFSR
jgi:hypothetical protein